MSQTTPRRRVHLRPRHVRPASHPSPTQAFRALLRTARRLQGPGGCPWDRAQTLQTLVPHLIEETWEVFCAARQRRRAPLREELGDVLYTVIFLSLLAERQGWFTLGDVLSATDSKMRRRHPHVFGRKQAHTPEEAYAHWQTAKRQEKRSRHSPAKMRPLLIALWTALLSRRRSSRTRQQALNLLKRLR